MSGDVEISVSVPCEAWLTHVPEAIALCRDAAAAALEAGGLEAIGRRRPVEVSVVLADDGLVRGLNRTYRGRNEATNVLSFANRGGSSAVNGSASSSGRARHMAAPDSAAPLLLGDVVVAFETAAAEAGAAGKGLEAHLCLLVVHGVLHFLGYDHVDDAKAARMERLEASILGRLGLPDPCRRGRAASE
ncbi:MAG: rRNA maturation RNase YbeY [Alphaproteobacteria bacterium]